MVRTVSHPRLVLAAVIVVGLLAVAAVLEPAARSATRSSGATVAVGKTKLGRLLVDARGRTLYVFGKDKKNRSLCSGSCASFWPPLLTSAKPHAAGGVNARLLGTTARSDGHLQVTYNGHPLYTFSLDQKRGDTKGEGLLEFGATWYAISAKGSKIVKNASSSSSSGGGYGR